MDVILLGNGSTKIRGSECAYILLFSCRLDAPFCAPPRFVRLLGVMSDIETLARKREKQFDYCFGVFFHHTDMSDKRREEIEKKRAKLAALRQQRQDRQRSDLERKQAGGHVTPDVGRFLRRNFDLSFSYAWCSDICHIEERHR